MNETEHGFGRSGGMVLHDYPLFVRPFVLRQLVVLVVFEALMKTNKSKLQL